MLITTSRKPVAHSRRLAKALCQYFPGCVYASRGKESFEGLCESAYESGHNLICVIFEKHGSPSRLSLAKIVLYRDGAGYEYLNEAVAIKNIQFHPNLKQALNARHAAARISGDFSQSIMSLFGVEESAFGTDESGPLEAVISKNRISFMFEGKPCLELDYFISKSIPDSEMAGEG